MFLGIILFTVGNSYLEFIIFMGISDLRICYICFPLILLLFIANFPFYFVLLLQIVLFICRQLVDVAAHFLCCNCFIFIVLQHFIHSDSLRSTCHLAPWMSMSKNLVRIFSGFLSDLIITNLGYATELKVVSLPLS